MVLIVTTIVFVLLALTVIWASLFFGMQVELMTALGLAEEGYTLELSLAIMSVEDEAYIWHADQQSQHKGRHLK